MDIAVYFFQLISFLCELIENVAETVVFQFQKIGQLFNLHETVVSNNNVIQLRLNSLEKFVYISNDTQIRLNSLELKMQELQDKTNRSFEQLNQQMNKLNCHQEFQEKAVMSTDTKIEELQDQMNRSFEQLNQHLNKINYQQELKEKEVMSTDTKIEELEDVVSRSFEQLNQKLNEAICHQEMKKEESLMEEMKKEESLMKEMTQDVSSTDAKMQELYDLVSRSIETTNEQLNGAQKLKQRRDMPQEVMEMEAHVIKRKSADMLKDSSSISQLLDKFQFGSEEEQMFFESLCLKWTINRKDIVVPRKGSYEHLSDTFHVYRYQLKVQLKLTITSERTVELRLCFKNEEQKEKEVDIKPLPMVTFIIKDFRGQNRHLVSHCYCPFNCSLQYNDFGYWSVVNNTFQWNALISPCGKSLEVLVLMEPPTFIIKPLSIDGTITDTIEHYSRKLQMKKEGLIKHHWSPAFLTHAGGYRVAVRMYLDEPIGENMKQLKACVSFLSGEFDSQLDTKFNHETSITLINHFDAKKNITVEKLAKEAKSYTMPIACGDAISSGGFLVNDSLTYHVAIKPIIINQLTNL